MQTRRPIRISVCLFLLIALFALLPEARCQQRPDSVMVRGRIRNLTPELYRQSPVVTVSRNNILQASREMARPAPLEADGSFQVTLPLIYPYEELYFNFGRISTAFLASAGTVEISLDADSLYRSEVPFRFAGTNAQVNNQLALYKAFAFKNKPKTDARQLSKQLYDRSADDSRKILKNEFLQTYEKYRQTATVLPLLDRYIQSTTRYEVAAFLYDKAMAEQDRRLETNLSADSLRPANDLFMSVQRATAMERFAAWTGSLVRDQAQTGPGRSIPIPTFATLIDRYVPKLSEADRERIVALKAVKTGTNRDLTLLQRIYRENEENLSKLLAYEMTMAQYSRLVDSTGMDFLKATFLAMNLPAIELSSQKLLYEHILPQLADPRYRLSLQELYQLEVRDSVRVREVAERFSGKADNEPVEVLSGVTLMRSSDFGKNLLSRISEQARGRLVYVLAWSNDVEASRQAVLAARSVQDRLSSRDVLFVFVNANETSLQLWREWVAKNQPKGLHIYVDEEQMTDLIGTFRSGQLPAAGLLGRDGKILKRNAPLPTQPDELLKLIRERL
ncbi:TlpA family protein disulfide reductase [Larkinella soli]|uniref:TlpA family protein disulfide reductase n=1 Tax=Larkinella soli TaxID=1770527 RepID=UPI000FFC51E4|nr:hypothetical protein [Larkinella soli]